MRRRCQWIDEPEPAALPDDQLYSPALYCGRPVAPGRPYCSEHDARACGRAGQYGDEPDDAGLAVADDPDTAGLAGEDAGDAGLAGAAG